MSAPEVELTTTTTINLDDLAELLTRGMGRRCIPDSDLIDFVLTIDCYMADLDFTKALHRELGEAIELEEG